MFRHSFTGRQLRQAAAVASVVLAAMVCRICGRHSETHFAGYLRTFLYIGLFTAWSVSIQRRVIQMQVRSFLTIIAHFMVFWIFVRAVKFFIAGSPLMQRLCWYLYYLPMLFIPFLFMLVAASLGRADSYRLPRWTGILYLIPTCLFLLVMTNDLHLLVFRLPAGWQEGQPYAYGAAFSLILAWMLLCTLSALVIMLHKCRLPQRSGYRWLPLIPIGLSAAYSAAYACGLVHQGSLLHALAGDMTVTQCLLFAAILESCMQCGLIQTNTDYDALFEASTIGMQIIDNSGHPRYRSLLALTLPPETLQAAQAEGGCLLDSSVLLRSQPIRDGHIVWQENVAPLMTTQHELELVREELTDRNALLREQYHRDAERCRTEEQNRLYDLLQQETQRQLKAVEQLTLRLRGQDKTSPRTRPLLLRLLILTTYIKRRKDMVLSSDRSKLLPVNMLADALRESTSGLPLGGIEGSLYAPRHDTLVPVHVLISAYDFFEDALELSISSLQGFLVSLCPAGGVLQLTLRLDTEADLASLAQNYPTAVLQREEDGWFAAMPLTEGGGT